MANALYTKFVESYMLQEANQVDLVADTIKATLVDLADYTPDLALDEYISAVPAGARVATQTLAGKSVAARVFDADDVVFAAVTGDVSEALVLWKDTGVEATSRLVDYIDTAGGLPVTPNGRDIHIDWDDGANKILKL
ncbi:MAG TPA: hypothetical protein VGB35_11630 [Gammaproteobacteria bacterium]